MARNELFGIDVEEKEVKFDEIVEKKEEKPKKGEVKISDKLTFKTGDDAEIKEFLKKVIDTEDYNEELKLIVNEWIERKMEKTGEYDADEILFAHRYTDNLEGHGKKRLGTEKIGDFYYTIFNNGINISRYGFRHYTPFIHGHDLSGKIKKYEGKIPSVALVTATSLKKINTGLVLEIKGIGKDVYNSKYRKQFRRYVSYVDFIKFKFVTKDDINKLLNDLLEMTKLVITERKSINNIVDDFFG